MLLVVRHAESTWNAERRWAGQADPPLTARGEAQARALGLALVHAPARPVRVVTSDLRRAADTGRLAGAVLGVRPDRPDARLRERRVPFSGLTSAEIEALAPGMLDGWRRGTLVDLPGAGEPWPAFVDRVHAALRDHGRSSGHDAGDRPRRRVPGDRAPDGCDPSPARQRRGPGAPRRRRPPRGRGAGRGSGRQVGQEGVDQVGRSDARADRGGGERAGAVAAGVEGQQVDERRRVPPARRPRTGTGPPSGCGAGSRRRPWRRRASSPRRRRRSRSTRAGRADRRPARPSCTTSGPTPTSASADRQASPTQRAARPTSSSHSGSPAGTIRSTQQVVAGSTSTTPPPDRRRTTATPARVGRRAVDDVGPLRRPQDEGGGRRLEHPHRPHRVVGHRRRVQVAAGPRRRSTSHPAAGGAGRARSRRDLQVGGPRVGHRAQREREPARAPRLERRVAQPHRRLGQHAVALAHVARAAGRHHVVPRVAAAPAARAPRGRCSRPGRRSTGSGARRGRTPSGG